MTETHKSVNGRKKRRDSNFNVKRIRKKMTNVQNYFTPIKLKGSASISKGSYLKAKTSLDRQRRSSTV